MLARIDRHHVTTTKQVFVRGLIVVQVGRQTLQDGHIQGLVRVTDHDVHSGGVVVNVRHGEDVAVLADVVQRVLVIETVTFGESLCLLLPDISKEVWITPCVVDATRHLLHLLFLKIYIFIIY